jgi:hypothetical protein
MEIKTLHKHIIETGKRNILVETDASKTELNELYSSYVKDEIESGKQQEKLSKAGIKILNEPKRPFTDSEIQERLSKLKDLTECYAFAEYVRDKGRYFKYYLGGL